MKIKFIKNELLQDKCYFIGVLLVIFSSLIFMAGSLIQNEGEQLGIFFLNYLITAGYWITLIFSIRSHRFYRFFPALVLSLISAYSLNKLMNIFDLSPWWLSLTLVIISGTCLTLPFFNQMNRLFRTLILAVVGVGMMLFLYLSIYLIPIYPFSFFVFWALGISLHGLVPIVFLIILIVWVCRFALKDLKALWGLAFGIIGIVIGAGVFTLLWIDVVSTMNKPYRETFVEDDVTLPAWVRVAQRIPQNAITNMALKVGLTYVLPDSDSWILDRFPSRFVEQKIHNPFIVIACFLSEEPCLNDEEKIKILESIYDCRQQATERLWNDDGVETSWVNSSVLIWPQYRTSYTEQVIMVRNVHDSWRPGEAVYTFHLPEGSVVTSLSLWINGKEEKGILTTKSKADEAYRTIVGVESRDPSLVHWQEGSTVSVRVFPVTQEEERTFKIGITSPLVKQNNRLIYKPIYFEGTDFSKAKEKITVKMMEECKVLNLPSFLKDNATGFETSKDRKYDPQWEILMQEVALSSEPFCFDGYCYQMKEIHPQNIAVDIQNVYLDINSSWSIDEFIAVYDALKGKKVWVYDGQEMIAVNAQNMKLVFRQLQQLQFSLFPVHLINKPPNSLLVSKSVEVSPNLSDLEDSIFLQSLKGNSSPIYFFNLGNKLSPYLKTLREYRVLNYSGGNVSDLEKILQQSLFEQVVETDSCVAIHDAGIYIEKQQGVGTSKAPDHLMRLFAYNHIMQQYAQSWNTTSLLTDSMVTEAQQAYVVSPVSSLVVLESQKDYDRFGIEDTENSLKNASKSSKGAVPEPHEWALIILSLVTVVILYRKKLPLIG